MRSESMDHGSIAFPVRNQDFSRFVEEAGCVTFAEIPQKSERNPGALPEMLYAGSSVFITPKQRSPNRAAAQL